MLKREHQVAPVHDTSLRQSVEEFHSSKGAQLCVSSTMDNQETGMPFARDVTIDACSVQLAGAATMASASFNGLIYEVLLSRPELAAAITAFAVSLVNCLVTDTGIVHQVGLQVLCKYLQEVYNSLSGGVWMYTKAELLESFAVLLQQGQMDAYHL